MPEQNCTKDGCAQTRAKGKPWCLRHLAEYQRDYRGTVLEMSNRKGFRKGVEAMRRTIIEEFTRPGISNGTMTGADVAVLIHRMPGPDFAKETDGEPEDALDPVAQS